MRSRIRTIVVRMVTISRTKMTGFFARVRGSSLAKAEPIAGHTILGAVSAVTGIRLCKREVSIGATPKPRSEELACHHGEMLHDRPECECREEREAADNEDDADDQADEEATMGGESAG